MSATGEAHLIEQLLLCQNTACRTPLALGHLPWTSGRLAIICGGCKLVSEFRPTNEGIVAKVVPPSPKLARK
jgi:hypothetical protein